MSTPRELIADALSEIGVAGTGKTVDAGMEQHAMRRLNDFLAQCAVDPGTISKVTSTDWTITAGTQDYAVGAGQVVNVARPALIAVESIAFVDTSLTPSQEFSRARPYSEEEWADVSTKALEGTYPQRAYYNPTTPYGLLTIYPKPTSTTLTGVLYALEAIAQLVTADLSNDWVIPDDYRRMFVKNLALELAPAYERSNVSPLLVAQARESRATVRAANFRPENMRFPRETLISPMSGDSLYDIRRG